MIQWVCDRPHFPDSHIDRDLSLAESVLHQSATSGPPYSASSSHLGSKDDVTLVTAAKGIGPAGSVHGAPDLWDTWADSLFEAARHNAPSRPPTACPKAAAMLRALFHDGLFPPMHDPANAQVFVKYKSQEKAALIVNMVNFNHSCAHKARRFRLPTLEGLAHSLRTVCAHPSACKLDLKNCYWSVHLPPSLINCIRVADGTNRSAAVRVLFGWHQAPGLVEHLIDRVMSFLPRTAVLIIQYSNHILFVGPRPGVHDMARRAAAALEQARYILSLESELEPTKLITWMGKRVNLNSAAWTLQLLLSRVSLLRGYFCHLNRTTANP